VELQESKVSGLVHISQLSNDYYHFDPVRHLLKGERTGLQFRLGDHVRVQVLRASLEDRKIDFRLVPPGKKNHAPAPAPAGKRYDYGAAGDRYSLPGNSRTPLPSLPPVPGREREAKHGTAKPTKKSAGGKLAAMASRGKAAIGKAVAKAKTRATKGRTQKPKGKR
jgi:ribonuclease R